MHHQRNHHKYKHSNTHKPNLRLFCIFVFDEVALRIEVMGIIGTDAAIGGSVVHMMSFGCANCTYFTW